MPDDELLAHAAAGDLAKPAVLLAQVRRMLKDDRARGLATEFGGNWLDFRHFENLNSVDRERFPSFNDQLREAMFEEPIRFITDVIHNDRPVLDLLYGKYTFVNPVLAATLRHACGFGRTGSLGSRGQCRRLWPRRPAADGRVPDAERAGSADQSGEARVLGGAPRARRSDSAAAARGPGTSARRVEVGSAGARSAGETPGQCGLRLLPRAFRFVRAGV